jgi:hypothetical protein
LWPFIRAFVSIRQMWRVIVPPLEESGARSAACIKQPTGPLRRGTEGGRRLLMPPGSLPAVPLKRRSVSTSINAKKNG